MLNSDSNYSIVRQFSNRGIVVDTGVLLLFYAGATSESLIKKFKRTQTFNVEDFLILKQVLSNFNKRFTTPQVMAEVSNLAGGIHETSLQKFFDIVQLDLSTVEETYSSTESLFQVAPVTKFGFTDVSLICVAMTGPLLLSTDYRLCGWCDRTDIAAINFNWLRTF